MLIFKKVVAAMSGLLVVMTFMTTLAVAQETAAVEPDPSQQVDSSQEALQKSLSSLQLSAELQQAVRSSEGVKDATQRSRMALEAIYVTVSHLNIALDDLAQYEQDLVALEAHSHSRLEQAKSTLRDVNKKVQRLEHKSNRSPSEDGQLEALRESSARWTRNINRFEEKHVSIQRQNAAIKKTRGALERSWSYTSTTIALLEEELQFDTDAAVIDASLDKLDESMVKLDKVAQELRLENLDFGLDQEDEEPVASAP